MKISQILEKNPKWQHKEAKVRLKSLKTSTLSQEDIKSLAFNDLDFEVRVCAIEQLLDPSSLQDLARSNFDGFNGFNGSDDSDDSDSDSSSLSSSDSIQLQEAARARWLELIGGDLDQFAQITKPLPVDLLSVLAKGASLLSIKCKAAEQISAPALLEEILLEHNHSEVHQLCAEKIEDKTVLENIYKTFLHKDKNVTRIVKHKLQLIKANHERQENLHSHVEKCLHSIERLANSEYNDEYPRRLSVLLDARSGLDFTAESLDSEAFQIRLNIAFDTCQQNVSKENQKKQVQNSVKENIIERLQSLTKALISSAAPAVTLSEVLQAAKKDWPESENSEQLDTLIKPLAELNQHYQSWNKLILGLDKLAPQQQLDQLDAISWPEGFIEPETLNIARSKARANASQVQQSRDQQQSLLKDLRHQLDQFATQVDGGHIKQASKLHTSLSKKIKGLTLPHDLSENFLSHTNKLNELRDWQGFVTIPKREALCESMSALAKDELMPAPEKAQAIKELQVQWKKLGSSETRQAQRLWLRFKKQGDLAFAPCAIFFAHQKNIRDQNFKEKENICTALEAFADEIKLQHENAEHTDWKALQEVITGAKKEWHRYDDIIRSKYRQIQKRFDKTLKFLYDSLKAEKANNHKLKIALIQEVAELSEAESTINEKTNKTKNIQSRWKQIGITDHKVDQKLWKRFRSECDKVFELRTIASVAEKQKLDSVANDAKELCQSFNALLESEQTLQNSDINKFKKTFNAIPLGKQHNRIQSECQKLIKSANKIINSQHESSQKQMMTELKRIAKLCDAYELGELDAAALESAWQSEISLETSLQESIRQRFLQGTRASFEAIEKLCVRLEILAEIESPPESQAARMAYQVERLNKELSKGVKETRSVAEQIREIQILWYCQSTDEASKKIGVRFHLAESKLGV